MGTVYYKTNFNLVCPVNDMAEAQNYLQEDDMTKYLIDSLRYDKVDEQEIAKISNIYWALRDEQSGYILLTTTDVLPMNVLDKISDWVSGQNSDGLGEGFEQQPFAEYRDEYYDDEDEYSEYNMASFDWETNDYKFKRVSSPHAIIENHVFRIDELV